MKRWIQGGICLLLLLVLTACGKAPEELDLEGNQNMVLVKEDGTIRSLTVESFEDETRYKDEELRAFVEESVQAYNQAAGGERVQLLTLYVGENQAKLILSYTSATDFTAFNGVELQVTNPGEAGGLMEIPDVLYSAKKGEEVTGETAVAGKNAVGVSLGTPMEGENPYQLLTEKKIRYYAGGTLEDAYTIQGTTESKIIGIYE